MMLLILILVLIQTTFSKNVQDKPQQIHLSYGDNPLKIVVTWSTLNNSSSTVEYGVENFNKANNGFCTKFTDGGVKKNKQYIHRVHLVNLEPNTKYVYHCGSGNVWSEDLWFKTPKISTWKPKLAIFGDLSNRKIKSFHHLRNDVMNKSIDAVLHIGDMAYDMHSKNGVVGDEFMRKIQPISAHIPYMVCPGNHERKYHYKARFTMPGNTDNYYYSFNMGPAHFISLNIELYFKVTHDVKKSLENQYLWLLNDLKEASSDRNRTKRPWIIVYSHKPMYSFVHDNLTFETLPYRVGFTDEKCDKCFGLEKIFYENKIDFYFAGHVHTYERSFPVYNSQVFNKTAPIHITSGIAGPKKKTVISERASEWSAYRSSEYSYSLIQFYNKTHAKFQQISLETEGKVLDELWVEKN